MGGRELFLDNRKNNTTNRVRGFCQMARRKFGKTTAVLRTLERRNSGPANDLQVSVHRKKQGVLHNKNVFEKRFALCKTVQNPIRLAVTATPPPYDNAHPKT